MVVVHQLGCWRDNPYLYKKHIKQWVMWFFVCDLALEPCIHHELGQLVCLWGAVDI